jgi:hypothetical protein
MPTAPDLLGLLYEALHSPLGIVVSTNNPEALRSRLYPMRKEDPNFLLLTFSVSPDSPDELWIIKRAAPDAQEP